MHTLDCHGVINSKTERAAEEVDRIIITGVNLEALRKVDLNWPEKIKHGPSHRDIENLLKKLGYKENEIDSPKEYILDEGEHMHVIDKATWKKYWEIKGEEPNGWNIPSAETIYKTITFFNKNKKNMHETPNDSPDEKKIIPTNRYKLRSMSNKKSIDNIKLEEEVSHKKARH